MLTFVPRDQRRAGDVVHSYVQTQYRAGSFLIGMLLGYFLFKIKHEQKTVKFTKVNILMLIKKYNVYFLILPREY